MSSTALKIAAVVLVLLTLLLAVVGFSMSRSYAERTAKAEAASVKIAEEQAAVPKTLAVVAIKPLAAYQPVSRDDIALVPVVVLPAEYFASIEEVAGRIPLIDIDTGAPVTQRYFKQGNILAKIIPAGHQALALEVNEVIAAGGFVKPGDNVDVLVYLRTGPGVAEAQARVLLENARVLAFEERIIERPKGLKEDDAKTTDTTRRKQRTAVLAVPEGETTRVMLGASLGELRLALRGQQAETGEEAGDTTEGGLPFSEAAKTAVKDRKVPDKAVTAADIAKVKLPPVVTNKPPPPPPVTVEVLRGAQAEKVPQ